MNKNTLGIAIILLITLLMGASVGFGIHKYYFTKTEIHVEMDTVFQSTEHHYQNNLKPTYITEVIDTVEVKYIDTIYMDLDTLKVINDFFTRKLITKNFKDSIIDLKTSDSLYMNQITWSNLSYDVKVKTIDKVITIKPKNKALLLGLDIGFNKISPNLNFKVKKNTYCIGIDFYPGKKSINLGYKYQFLDWD